MLLLSHQTELSENNMIKLRLTQAQAIKMLRTMKRDVALKQIRHHHSNYDFLLSQGKDYSEIRKSLIKQLTLLLTQ